MLDISTSGTGTSTPTQSATQSTSTESIAATAPDAEQPAYIVCTRNIVKGNYKLREGEYTFTAYSIHAIQ